MQVSKSILIILFLLTAAAVCYGNILNAGFVWDDEFLVVQNPQLRAPLWAFQPFKQDVINSGFIYSIYYRPVQLFNYALDYRLWGMNPFGFHLSSVFLHFLNSLLVFLIVLKLTKEEAISLLAALLFVIHPAYAGAVSYISSRADLLFFFFGFLYMLFYILFLEKKKPLLLGASIVSLALALLSKEVAVIFPFLLLLTGMVVLKERKSTYHVPAFLIVGIYAAAHYILFGNRYTSILKLGNLPEVLSGYFGIVKESLFLLIFPVGLHMRRVAHFLPKEQFVLIGIVVIAIGSVFYLKEKRRILLFSLIFFLMGLVPFLFVTGSLKVFAEHWLYLPSFGIFLFVSVLLLEAYKKRKKVARCLILTVIFIIITVCTIITRSQNKYWQTTESLSKRVLAFSEEDDAAMFYEAVSSKKEKIGQEALDNMEAYIQTRPTDLAALYLQGRWRLASGNIDEAEHIFKTVLAAQPDNFDSYVGMALVCLDRGDEQEAIKQLERAIEISPRHSEALLILESSYAQAGEDEKALEAAKKAYKIKPYDYTVLISIGTAYSRMGYLREGATYYLEATQLYPEKPLAFYDLGKVFLAGGEEGQARRWLRKAIMLDPEFKAAEKLLRSIKPDEKY